MFSGPSALERRSAYRRVTGLKIVGQHRSVADRWLRGLSHRCRQCGGNGFRQVGRSWIWCDACGGLGRLLTPKAQQLLRQRVLEHFPAAAEGGDEELGPRAE